MQSYIDRYCREINLNFMERCQMKVEQFVMAYGVEQDRLRGILPEGFVLFCPVLRINAEVRDDSV